MSSIVNVCNVFPFCDVINSYAFATTAPGCSGGTSFSKVLVTFNVDLAARPFKPWMKSFANRTFSRKPWMLDVFVSLPCSVAWFSNIPWFLNLVRTLCYLVVCFCWQCKGPFFSIVDYTSSHEPAAILYLGVYQWGRGKTLHRPRGYSDRIPWCHELHDFNLEWYT